MDTRLAGFVSSADDDASYFGTVHITVTEEFHLPGHEPRIRKRLVPVTAFKRIGELRKEKVGDLVKLLEAAQHDHLL